MIDAERGPGRFNLWPSLYVGGASVRMLDLVRVVGTEKVQLVVKDDYNHEAVITLTDEEFDALYYAALIMRKEREDGTQ